MDVITQLEATPLSLDELKRMLTPKRRDTDTKLILYDDLKQFEDLQHMFGKDKAVIILLQIEKPNAPKVGHFIAMLDMDDHYEHFDSYGLNADEELAITHEQPFLTQLIQTSSKRLAESTTRYQHIREHTNTCGRWAVGRVLLQDLNLKEFKEVISAAHAVPDVTISLMTMFLL